MPWLARYTRRFHLMKFAGILILAGLCSVTASAQKYSCLPADVQESTVVNTSNSGRGAHTVTPITVKQTLNKLKARCSHGKLLDRKGKQIRFYNLQGCWGNPPPDYLEIIEKQRTDLDNLKKKYTVVEITCNPSGFPLP